MLKVMRWIGYAVGAVLLLVIVLWAVSRLRGPSAGQEQALALMEKPWQPQGRNAFAAMWLLQYDVPETEQAAIVAEDARRLGAVPVAGFEAGADRTLPAFESVAKDRYRDLSPSAQDLAMFCGTRETGCLDKVGADIDAYSALAKRNEALFARVAALSKYDYDKNGLAWRLDTPFPRFGLGNVLMTQHALEFARGDLDAALDGTCRDIATWRRLGANSDSLIARMIGIAYSTDGYGRLLAEMLEPLPPDIALPQSCVAALAPMSPQELSLCRPLQGEFQFSNGTLETISRGANASRWNRLLSPLVFDARMTRADMASTFAPTCSAAALQKIAGDVAPVADTASPSRLRLQCASNIVGCILADIARPAYIDYERRAQDQGARVQLLATLLWLRDSTDYEDEMPLAEHLALRPENLKSPTRDIEITKDGAAIRIRQFDTNRGQYWQVPLPKYFRPGGQG